MSRQSMQIVRRLLMCGVVAAFAVAQAPVSQAGDMSTDQMVKALQKKQGKTRSILATDSNDGGSQVQNAVEQLGGRITREIVVEERKQIAKAVVDNKLPAIDLSIPFDYDSAAITQRAVPVLAQLGQVLTHQSFSSATFLVGGHTDASGSDEYNIKLSQRRAQAVRDFLMNTFKISGDKLIAVGFGEIQLKVVADPKSAENRRVQLVNVTK